jgi:hypothetical protein
MVHNRLHVLPQACCPPVKGRISTNGDAGGPPLSIKTRVALLTVVTHQVLCQFGKSLQQSRIMSLVHEIVESINWLHRQVFVDAVGFQSKEHLLLHP